MTRNETLQVLAIIKVAYPNSFTKLTKQDVDALTSLWERQFKDYDANLVISAIDTIIATDVSDFMPSIARIKQVCSKLSNPNQITEIEAWQYVKKALQNALYNAVEEFDKLPSIVQTIVGSPRRLKDWALMPSSEVETFIYNNFVKSFNIESEREREQSLIPIGVKQNLMIANASEEEKDELLRLMGKK